MKHILQNYQHAIVLLGGTAVLLALILMFTLLEHSVFSTDTEEIAEYPTAPASPYLGDEEVVLVQSSEDNVAPTALPVEKVLFEYVQVVDGCGIHYENACLNVRSGPGVDYPVVAQLRNDIVLKVDGMVERDGITWFKIVFDEWLRYPERVTGDWYVHADYVDVLLDEGDRTTDTHDTASTSKTIIVDRSDQMLYAYEGDELYMEATISTGLALTPTPRGTFTVFKKTPSRYMQGPLPNLPADQYYDLPGVPWNLYFTEGGAVIHGTYWHDSFGQPYSHGCVNMVPAEARKLYAWAPLGTTVVVRD